MQGKRNKAILAVAIGLTLIGVGFAGGWYVARSGVVTYRNGRFGEAYHRDWPTYGIPIAEYLTTKALLDAENAAGAHMRLDTFLDQAVLNAKCRWAVATQKDREQLRRPLWKLAKYRKTHPRPLYAGPHDTTNIWWNRDRQEEVDNFLVAIDAMGTPTGMRPIADTKFEGEQAASAENVEFENK
jgi:hypothetical protein